MLILVMDLSQAHLGNDSAFTEFALTIIVVHLSLKSSVTIFGRIMQFDPSPSRRVDKKGFELSVNLMVVEFEGSSSMRKLKHALFLSSHKLIR